MTPEAHTLLSVALLVLAQVVAPTPQTDPSLGSKPPSAVAPSPVVERVVTLGERTQRVTLFTNGVAVVTVREGDQQVFFRKLTLSVDEFSGYLAAIQRDAPDAKGVEQLDASHPHAVIILHVGPESPRKVVYSPMQVIDLATSRLVHGLDDLEQVVSDTSPSEDALRRWDPQRGDIVEMWGGQRARVRDVEEGGVVVLYYVDTAMIEVVPPNQRGQRIRRVVIDDP